MALKALSAVNKRKPRVSSRASSNEDICRWFFSTHKVQLKLDAQLKRVSGTIPERINWSTEQWPPEEQWLFASGRFGRTLSLGSFHGDRDFLDIEEETSLSSKCFAVYTGWFVISETWPRWSFERKLRNFWHNIFVNIGLRFGRRESEMVFNLEFDSTGLFPPTFLLY